MEPPEDGVKRITRRRTQKNMDIDGDTETREPMRMRRERLVHHYGAIKGEEVGKLYKNREKLRAVHYPDNTWVHLGPEGPYSIILQGTNRFLDEGNLVAISTIKPVESDNKKTAGKTISANFKKALKGQLPIRIIRLVKYDKKPVFRYDGLYRVRKRFILHEKKIHFLLSRIKKQTKIHFNLKRGSRSMMRLLALRKRKRKIKKEPEVKKEVASNSDTERESTSQEVEEILTAEELKRECTALRESSYDHNDDGGGYEVWQRSVMKSDSNEQLDEQPCISYDDETLENIDTYYENSNDTNEELIQVDEHFSKEEVIIGIPLLKSENEEDSSEDNTTILDNSEDITTTLDNSEEITTILDNTEDVSTILGSSTEDIRTIMDNNEDVTTILAIVPESRTSDYVEDTANSNLDPLCDPLGGFSDESKNSNCSDDVKNSSQEVKKCYDEQKSDQMFLEDCGSGSEEQFLPTMPHPCLYNLTIGHLINLLGNRSRSQVCPCNFTKCAAQKNFEVALRGLIDESGIKSINPSCLKRIEGDDTEQLESTEINYFSSLNNVFNQLNSIICKRTTISETRTRLIGRRHHIINTRILKKERRGIQNDLHKEKENSDEESFIPLSVQESLVDPSVEESLLSTSINDSLAQSNIEDSSVPSEVPPSSAPDYGVVSPLPENTAIRLPSVRSSCLDKSSDELDPNDDHNKRRKGRQKGSRNSLKETAQLGPVIPTEDPKPIPRRLRDKKISYRGATFYISPRNISSRSASRKRIQEEEEDDFLGFVGPFRPSKKLKLVRSYLNRLSS